MVALKVNGEEHRLEVDPQTSLLWVLRENLGLMGTKFSCGKAECGACTVLADGEPIFSCVTPLADVAGQSITTIEGLNSALGKALKRAWLSEQVSQCGYCQPGQIMTAAGLLAKNPKPSEEQVKEALDPVLCRCGTYPAIIRAVLKASKEV
jgi:isoquinoline 1-oxidoreductase alpha subunit